MINNRIPDFPISNQFVERWSPRAFTGEPIDETTLFTFLEAARWAPSSYNAQPWRFIYARRDTEHWPILLGLLSEFNQDWAKEASALVILLSKKTFVPPGKTAAVFSGSHSFDAGAAWSYLALQAALSGWAAHGIGGIDKDKTREVLAIPDDYQVEMAIAIGRLGDRSRLPESLQAGETPNSRRPLQELLAEGRFDFKN